jgi:hypothetical protein
MTGKRCDKPRITAAASGVIDHHWDKVGAGRAARRDGMG